MSKSKYRKLLNEGLFSDVTFLIENKKDPKEIHTTKVIAHKNILAVSSPVFYSMFTGHFAESREKEVRITDVAPSTFKELIDYLYTNEEPSFNSYNWAPLLYASEKYELTELKEKCLDYVQSHCNDLNACSFFNQARRHSVETLVSIDTIGIALNAEMYLSSSAFLDIHDRELLREILSSDDLNCDEIIVFRSALAWAQTRSSEPNASGSQLRKALGPAFNCIRFPLINPNDLVREVIPSNVLTNEEIVSILKKDHLGDNPLFSETHRTRLIIRFPEESIAPIHHKRHEVKFKVDHPIAILGFGSYAPSFKGDSLRGKMMLVQGEGEATSEPSSILCVKSFKLTYSKGIVLSVIPFSEPVRIYPNHWYTARLDLDSTLPSRIWMGYYGQSVVKSDGIKWTFKNASSKLETSVFYGLIPMIQFVRVHHDF